MDSRDASTPKAELKAFQKAFKVKHGRNPTKAEVTGDPAIAALYARYEESKTTSKQSLASAGATGRPELTEMALFKQQADQKLQVEEAPTVNAQTEEKKIDIEPIIHRIPNEIWLSFVIPKLDLPSLVCFARSHRKFRRLCDVRPKRAAANGNGGTNQRNSQRGRCEEDESGNETESESESESVSAFDSERGGGNESDSEDENQEGEILPERDEVWRDRAHQYGFTKSLGYSYSSWFSLCWALTQHGWPAQSGKAAACRVCSSLFEKQMQKGMSQSKTHKPQEIDIIKNLRYPSTNPAADYRVCRNTRDRPTVAEAHWVYYSNHGRITNGIHLHQHVVLSSLVPTTRPVTALCCQIIDPEVPGELRDGRGYAMLRKTKVVNWSGLSTLDLMNAGATWSADLPPGTRFRNKADFAGLQLQEGTVLFVWERHYTESEDSEASDDSDDSDVWDPLTDVEEYERRKEDAQRRAYLEREREERGYIPYHENARPAYAFRPY